MASFDNDPHVSVLVVEDEPLIRLDLVESLEREGYLVYEAAHAAEAIALLEAHSEIRLLFTDIQMPGSMDGLKLSHYVRERWPPVTIVISSGELNPNRDEMPKNAVFISKPYKAADVIGIFSKFGLGN